MNQERIGIRLETLPRHSWIINTFCPFEKDRQGNCQEGLFFHIVGPDDEEPKRLSLIITHVRRRKPEEIKSGKEDKIWKKVKGRQSFFSIQLTQAPLVDIHHRTANWLNNQRSFSGNSSLLDLLPHSTSQEMSPLKGLFQTLLKFKLIEIEPSNSKVDDWKQIRYRPLKINPKIFEE